LGSAVQINAQIPTTEDEFDQMVFEPLYKLSKRGTVLVGNDTETTKITPARGFNPFYGPRIAMIQYSWNDGPVPYDAAVCLRMKPGLVRLPERPDTKAKNKQLRAEWREAHKQWVETGDVSVWPEWCDLEVERPSNVDPEHVIRRMNELTDEGLVYVYKNMMFDLQFLWIDGFVIPKIEQLEEVEIQSHLTEDKPWHKGRRVSHHLASLAERHLNREAVGEGRLDQWFSDMKVKNDSKDYSAVPYASILGPYGCHDTRDTLDLFHFFQGKLDKHDEQSAPGRTLRWLYEDEKLIARNLVEKTMIPGFGVDQGTADELLVKHETSRDEMASTLYQMTGRQIDWSGGTNELASYLFDPPAEGGLGLAVPEFGWTDSGERSVSHKVLEELDTPLTAKILEWRTSNTFINSFLEPIARFNIEGFIHPNFRLVAVRTGRLSCSHPNMQNRPKDKDVRSMFVPRKGYVLLDADYDQVEMRIAAHYAYQVCTKVPTVWYKAWGRNRKSVAPDRNGLWEGFVNDPDFDPHQIMADLSGLPRSREHAGQTTCKEVNFGILYGSGIRGMCKNYGWEQRKAKDVRSWFYKAYPEIAHLKAFIEKQLADRGWIANEFGRRYYIDKMYLALNYLIQGCAGDLIKRAKNKLYLLEDQLREEYEGAHPFRIINTVHDEVVTEVREDLLDAKFVSRVDAEMTTWKRYDGSDLFCVPITAGYAVSASNWGDLEDYEWKEAA